MPQGFASSRIERFKRVTRRTREDQIAGSRKQTGIRRGFPGMTPFNFTGLVVDREQHGFRESAAVVAAPSLRIVRAVVEIVDAERAVRADIEQTCIRTKRGGIPVRGASLVG